MAFTRFHDDPCRKIKQAQRQCFKINKHEAVSTLIKLFT